MVQNMNDVSSNSKTNKLEAVRTIERSWCSYRDKQMFRLLKYAICAAEHSLTFEVLRKVSPLEAELLKDPTVHARVRFRFGGSEFPPIIMFKIYVNTRGQGLKYYSGKRMIKPASKAACDSLKLMGNRKFYDQITVDVCQHEKDKITDEIDVTTMKDYMQYLSHLDESSADVGGRANTWRKLTLEVIPRQNIVHDVFSYLDSGFASPRLKQECPYLLNGALLTQEQQCASIKAITQYRRRQKPIYTSEGSAARRSRQARDRAEKMRKIQQTTIHHKAYHQLFQENKEKMMKYFMMIGKNKLISCMNGHKNCRLKNLAFKCHNNCLTFIARVPLVIINIKLL